MNRTFSHFNEIEQDVALNAPPVVYKYRVWKEEEHKSLFSKQHIWFAHPFSLPDPLDVRPDTVFNIDEFFDERYFEKLLRSASNNPDLKTEDDKINAAKEQWELTKSNPHIVLENLKQFNSVESHFDHHGIFSTCMSELSEKVWNEYGDNFSGFCVGFKTVELCRIVPTGCGYVEYCDDPISYSFLDKKEDSEMRPLYYKKVFFEQEKEFRFITAGIGITCERLQVLPVDIATEIILGYNMGDYAEKEIREIIVPTYPKEIKIYKLGRDAAGKLVKKQAG